MMEDNNNLLDGDIETGSLTGATTVPKEVNLDSLDEPVHETVLRDLKQVYTKVGHVLFPRSDGLKALRDWDLWGPLVLCLCLGSSITWGVTTRTAEVFTTVFVLVWCGAAVVTLNSMMLGGKVSFFQSVCVLGYCIAPLNIASLLSRTHSIFAVKAVVVLVCYLWCNKASIGFMASMVTKEKKLLAVYPICLFYLALAWLVLTQS